MRLPVTTLDSLTDLMNDAGFTLREMDVVNSVAIFEKEGEMVLMIVGLLSNASEMVVAEYDNFLRHRDN